MADAPANQSAYGDVNPWLIAVLVAVATFMEVLDTTIANVALRYISGGLAVSGDEASWVVTTYLVANSVVLAASGWIAEMFGRKNFFRCAFRCSRSARCSAVLPVVLQALLLFRLMQGLAGGGIIFIAQSILAAAFPPAKRNQGFALYGIAVVVAPVVGPTLGRCLSDNLILALVLSNQCAGRHYLLSLRFISSCQVRRRGKETDKSFGPKAAILIWWALFLSQPFLGSLEVCAGPWTDRRLVWVKLHHGIRRDLG